MRAALAILLLFLSGCSSFTLVGPVGYVHEGKTKVWTLGFSVTSSEEPISDGESASLGVAVQRQMDGSWSFGLGPWLERHIVVPAGLEYITGGAKTNEGVEK